MQCTATNLTPRYFLELKWSPKVNDSPWKSASLHDFWSNRWNLRTQASLKRIVHDPLLPSGRIVAVLGTFCITGILHEWMLYAAHGHSTHEQFWFFMIHGVFVVIEGCYKDTQVAQLVLYPFAPAMDLSFDAELVLERSHPRVSHLINPLNLKCNLLAIES